MTTSFHGTLTGIAAKIGLLLGLAITSVATPGFAAPPDAAPGRTLNRMELHLLETIANRAEEMMDLSKIVRTRIWPHAITDARGRQGIFISCTRPLFDEKDVKIERVRQAWVVFGVISILKYAEHSQLGHIAFTDANGLQGERYYYDLDIAPAREIRRDFLRGHLSVAEAYDAIVARWEKVTDSDHLALK